MVKRKRDKRYSKKEIRNHANKWFNSGITFAMKKIKNSITEALKELDSELFLSFSRLYDITGE